MADRGLLIGINDYRDVPPLRGAVNDVAAMRATLVDALGFPEDGIRSLVDADAVKPNVREELRRLASRVGPADRLVVHFSGHGSYAADNDGDEPDGYDELFCLHDMIWGNPDSYLLDDEIRGYIDRLPPVRDLIIVLDACHSGTGLRLIPRPDPACPGRRIRPVSIDLSASLARAGGQPALEPGEALRHEIRNRFAVPPPDVEARAQRLGQPKPKRRVKRPPEKSRIMLIAACRSDQSAADAYFPEDHIYQGAMTRALCAILGSSPKITPKLLKGELVAAMRKGHFTQEPQVELA